MLFLFHMFRKKLQNQRNFNSLQGTLVTDTTVTTVSHQEDTAEVRASYQSNNYLEFKTDSHHGYAHIAASDPSPCLRNHHVMLNNRSQDQYGDAHGNEIRHTYFDPLKERESKAPAYYLCTNVADDGGKRSSEPKYASVI